MEGLSLFIQLEKPGQKAVRYFAVGILENNLLTGLVHGYEGGGEYSERLIYNGEYISSITKDDESIEWDEQLAELEERTHKGFYHELMKLTLEYITYNQDTCSYAALNIDENSSTLSIDFNAIPPSYANTTWKQDEATLEAFGVKDAPKDNQDVDIRYLLCGLIKAPAPHNFNTMSIDDKKSWATSILNDSSDDDIIKGTYHYETAMNGHVFDETPDVEAIETQDGEEIVASTTAWEYFSGRKREPLASSPLYEIKELAIKDDDIHSLVRDIHSFTFSEHINCFGEDCEEDSFEIRVSFKAELSELINNYNEDTSVEFSIQQLNLLLEILKEIDMCGYTFATVYKD